MSLDTLVAQLELEIHKIYQQHQQTRKKTVSNLRGKTDVTYVQKLIYNSIADAVGHLMDDAKIQKERAVRFRTIPKFFPSPDYSSQLDCLIYSRVLMGYTMMPHGQSGRRFKTTLKKLGGQEKYVAYLQRFAVMNELGNPNFHHLCKAGCPQATNEWMIVNDFPSTLVSDKAVIPECKRLLALYGY